MIVAEFTVAKNFALRNVVCEKFGVALLVRDCVELLHNDA